MSRFFILLLCLTFQTAYASRNVIIDTDAAFDDMLAMTYLLQRPDLSIKAITIAAAGETHCRPARKNIHNLLTYLNKNNIQVACGRSQPLTGNHHFPKVWSEFTDHLGNLKISSHSPPNNQTNAVDIIKNLLSDSKSTFDIVALGPLTNIGEALNAEPQLVKQIRMIYIMGGAVHVQGNLHLGDKRLNSKAEWNIYIDPYAANLVFHSNAPITLVPLDVTNQIKLNHNFYSIINRSDSSAAKYVNHLYNAFNSYNIASKTQYDWFAWDSLAAVIASDDTIATTITEKLRVIIDPDYNSGSMVIDNQNGQAIKVCHDVNQQRFAKELTYYLTHENSKS